MLGARFEAWFGSQEELNSDKRRMLLTIGEYIKANADEIEEFTIDHFVVKPFSNIGGLQRAVQTFGSEDKLEGIIASLNLGVFSDDGMEQQQNNTLNHNRSTHNLCH